MRRIPILTAVLLTTILVSGCVTKYVVLNEVAREEIPVTVLTTDQYRGGQLVAAIEERGYDNDDHKVVGKTRGGFGIRWGAAPRTYVEEIASIVEDRFDVRLRRSHDLKPGDFDVEINLPFANVEMPDRNEFEVTIFSDDEEKGEVLLAKLLALGYTNAENHVTSDPTDDFNIKWGGAPESYAEEIAALVEAEDDDIEVDLQQAWGYDDDDIFVNLPYWLLEPATRERFEITVFCDDEKLGEEILDLVIGLGYTNEDNEVLEGPNDDFNVKYGALPAEFLAEIVEALEEKLDEDFAEYDYFDDDDRDVFINIPTE